MTSDDSSGVPYTMTRLGVVMTPEPGNPHEAMGVLNPASGRAPDGSTRWVRWRFTLPAI